MSLLEEVIARTLARQVGGAAKYEPLTVDFLNTWLCIVFRNCVYLQDI